MYPPPGHHLTNSAAALHIRHLFAFVRRPSPPARDGGAETNKKKGEKHSPRDEKDDVFSKLNSCKVGRFVIEGSKLRWKDFTKGKTYAYKKFLNGVSKYSQKGFPAIKPQLTLWWYYNANRKPLGDAYYLRKPSYLNTVDCDWWPQKKWNFQKMETLWDDFCHTMMLVQASNIRLLFIDSNNHHLFIE